jgi:hypothetical protein
VVRVVSSNVRVEKHDFGTGIRHTQTYKHWRL